MLFLLDRNVRTVKWNGIPLHEASSAVVREETNGDFSLSVRYPITDSGIYQLIQEDMLIKAPVPVLGPQLFRIKKPVENDDSLDITAYHITDDIMKRSVNPLSVVGQGCATALSQMVQQVKTELGQFSFISNITEKRTFNTTEVETLYSVLLDGAHSIVGTWEGELVRDNFAMTIKKSRGIDRGGVITTHKNLKSYQRTKNSHGVVTRIHVTSTFKEEGAEEETTLRLTVDSPLINAYPYINEKEFENNNLKTIDDLRKWAEAKFKNEGIDKVSDAIEIEAYELDGQIVHLGDTVNLKSRKHNVDVYKKAIAYEFNALTEEYISITFDDKPGVGGSGASSGLSNVADAILGAGASAQEVAIERAIRNANQAFDAEFDKRVEAINDSIEQTKADAEVYADQIRQDIDQELSSFEQGFQTAQQSQERRISEILAKAQSIEGLANQSKADAASALARANQVNLDINRLRSESEAKTSELSSNLSRARQLLDAEIAKMNGLTSRVETVENTATGTKSTVVELTKAVDGNSRKSREIEDSLIGLKTRIESIQIGARNLLIDSQFFSNNHVMASKTTKRLEGRGTYFFGYIVDFKPDQEYTLSFTPISKTSSELEGYNIVIYTSQISNGRVKQTIGRFTGDEPITFTTNADITSGDRLLLYSSYGAVTSYVLEDIQLEKGNLKSDYQPAHEEAIVKLATYKQEVDQALSEIRRQTQDVDGTAREILTRIEQTADRLREEITRVEAKVPIESSGQNLLIDSKLLSNNHQFTNKTTRRLTGRGTYYFGYTVDFKPNQFYTLSLDKKIGNQIYDVAIYDPLIKTQRITRVKLGDSGSVTFTTSPETQSGDKLLIYPTFANAVDYDLEFLKLEEGNIRREWRQSPEDQAIFYESLKTSIDRTAEGVEQLSTRVTSQNNILTTHTTQIKGLNDEIAQKVGRTVVDGIEQRIVVAENAMQTNADETTRSISRIETDLAGKINRSEFNTVKERTDLYHRVMGATDETGAIRNLAEKIMTTDGFVTTVQKNIVGMENLVYDPTNYTKHRPNSSSSSSAYYITSAGAYKLLVIKQSGNAAPQWNGAEIPLRTAIFKQGEKLSYRINLWVDVVPDDYFRMEIKNGNTTVGGFQLRLSKKGPNQIYTGTFAVEATSNITDDFALKLWLRKNGQVAIGQISIVRGDRPPSEFTDSTSVMEVVTGTQVSQLNDSYAIKFLNSAGNLISQANLAGPEFLLEAAKIRLKGKTLADEIQAIDGKFNNLFVGDGTFGKLNSNIITTQSITGDKIKFDQSFFNYLMANEAYLKQLFAKNAFITQVQSVDISADHISGGVIEAINKALEINLNMGMIDFLSNNAAIRRKVAGYPNQYVKFISTTSSGAPSSSTVIGSNRDGSERHDNDTFAGIRIHNGQNIEFTQFISDNMEFVTGLSNRRGWAMNTVAGSDRSQINIYPIGNPTRSNITASHYIIRHNNRDVELNAIIHSLKQCIAAFRNINGDVNMRRVVDAALNGTLEGF